MNKKIILFSSKENIRDISLVHDKIKSFKPILVLCDNEELFLKSYDCNVIFIIYYNEDLNFLKSIINKFPRHTNFNLISIEQFLSNDLSLECVNNKILTNKFLMTYFLEKICISSVKLQEIIIKRILVNAINLNFPHITSSLIYFTIENLNLNTKKIIPDIREFLKSWLNHNNSKSPINLTTINDKTFRINNILTTILNEYIKFTSMLPNTKEFKSILENAFYLKKYYKNNIELTKHINSIIVDSDDNFDK